ncbi:type IV toxin-antitoxin system AbiEi family antitoxin domain-containing protein [Kribbella sp. CA-293567]|uniref:type IV toxin-antitoxin system AbiEi family antitoxin domain-containing protein n=1 Tax=Kribbella sp. CA-293567 TaxID=3002436 RepID=UPI0022DD4E5E|nr:type IV toxin-antitoxin system AbiEi family antitoxin domain-containing protein [Kribbella sp. CA-293567]WBQ06321.1 type IV toxin-antitoxin system AbiEi family antitoxin domain-containing protein [Kribbella sp. CA-293567]
MESIPEVLASNQGQATFAELRSTTSRRGLSSAVQSGAIERLTRGLYTLPAPPTDKQVALAYDGVVSHLSAAVAWGLPVCATPAKPHITVPRKRRPKQGPPAVMHWAPIASEDFEARVTSVLRTVLDCARSLPFDEALAVADGALNKGLMLEADFTKAADAMRGPGRPNARRVAAAVHGGAASFLESMLRALLLTEQIDGFEPQLEVETGSSLLRVDLGHQVARIALEAEGFAFHGSSSDFAADCRRYDELVAAGWLVLRFAFWHVLAEPAWVAGMIRAVLLQRLGVQSDRK